MIFRCKKFQIAVPLLIFLLLLTGGCRSISEVGGGNFRVAPFSSSEVAELSARQMVEVGRRAGFNREEILDRGTEIRNAIATHGGCRIYRNQRVRIIMAVHNRQLYVSMHTGANFIYDLR